MEARHFPVSTFPIVWMFTLAHLMFRNSVTGQGRIMGKCAHKRTTEQNSARVHHTVSGFNEKQPAFIFPKTLTKGILALKKKVVQVKKRPKQGLSVSTFVPARLGQGAMLAPESWLNKQK